MLGGCDVSQYQGVVDWPRLKASGRVSFVIMRATYGVAGMDAQFRANQAGARRVGIPRGYYHFADGFDAKSEAAHFLATVGQLEPGETLWLDDEIALPEHNAWACAFVDVLRPHVRVPGLYSNYSGFRNIGVVPGVIAWLAFPGPAPLTPPAGYTSAQTLINQTGTGAVPGISGNTDLDYLLAGIDTFTAWGAPGLPPDPPTEDDMSGFLYTVIGGDSTQYVFTGAADVPMTSTATIAAMVAQGLLKTATPAAITAADHAHFVAATTPPAPVVGGGGLTAAQDATLTGTAAGVDRLVAELHTP